MGSGVRGVLSSQLCQDACVAGSDRREPFLLLRPHLMPTPPAKQNGQSRAAPFKWQFSHLTTGGLQGSGKTGWAVGVIDNQPVYVISLPHPPLCPAGAKIIKC
ncbi:hypothetical protein KIL84_005702 [Mauremys mutica]|uniref:Uncharacterized protein n=1 Tax=Mauremys mutica TaxID=74926 RepID=A0A9D4AX34_9SAUR|nr:hypothetical protein KIL84_005702 [Mauremys mutica]